MTTRLLPGQKIWSVVRDSEGHRTYKVKYRVLCDKTDGPANALQTPGLPVYGSEWQIDNDTDVWAWCLWDATATPVVTDEPNTAFDVEVTFSTKPPPTRNCKEFQMEDPLLDPQKVSGSSSKYQLEATVDRFGKPVQNSAFEQMRGAQVEFDSNRGSVKIEQNVPSLQLGLCNAMMDCVNAFPLWGQQPRCVKLSMFTWERKFHGACYVYYTRTFEFDIDERGWDRNLQDEGTKCLHGTFNAATGHWDLTPMQVGGTLSSTNPNPDNPFHFVRFQDANGNHAKVILDGHGVPYDPIYVTTCSVCPQGASGPGAPQIWETFSFTYETGGLAVRLAYTNGCVWQAQYIDQNGSYQTAILTLGVGAGAEFTSSQYNGTWVNASTDFQFTCLGPFSLVNSAATAVKNGDPGGPEVIGFNGVGISGPGNIRIEKYQGVDFLLLGVPVVF